MSVKSVLAIGNVESYTGLICHTLAKGYRILYTGKLDDLSFLKQEDTKLIIIGNLTIDINPLENSSLVNLIKSEIPVILTKGNKFESLITDIFQDQCYFAKRMIPESSLGDCPLRRIHTLISFGNIKIQVALTEFGFKKHIHDTTECFFNGSQEKAALSDQLTFRQVGDFTSLELKRNEKAQVIHEGIEKAIVFMEKHYDKDISLNQIAQAACLSRHYFCRLFKKRVGINCNKYLSILRIEKAKELLKQKKLSVSEICFKVGFNYLTHFERVFKKLEAGKTPSEYRQFY